LVTNARAPGWALRYDFGLRRKLYLPIAAAVLVFQAHTADKFALTIDNIMRGPGLVGYEPAQVRWSYDSRHIYFQWKHAADKLEAPLDTYEAARDGGAPRKMSDEEVRALPPGFGGDTTRDHRQSVFTRDGDIFILDNTTGKTRQVTKTAEQENDVHFVPDGKSIYFTRGGNLFVMALDTGFLEQMTDIRPAAAPAGATPAAGGVADKAAVEVASAAEEEGGAAPRRRAAIRTRAPVNSSSATSRSSSSKRFATALPCARKKRPNGRRKRSSASRSI
jgi:hypothetical protein